MVARKVSDLGELSDAERQVLDELDTGEDIELGETVPAQDDESRRVRAGLTGCCCSGTIRNTSRTRRGSGFSGLVKSD